MKKYSGEYLSEIYNEGQQSLKKSTSISNGEQIKEKLGNLINKLARGSLSEVTLSTTFPQELYQIQNEENIFYIKKFKDIDTKDASRDAIEGELISFNKNKTIKWDQCAAYFQGNTEIIGSIKTVMEPEIGECKVMGANDCYPESPTLHC